MRMNECPSLSQFLPNTHGSLRLKLLALLNDSADWNNGFLKAERNFVVLDFPPLFICCAVTNVTS